MSSITPEDSQARRTRRRKINDVRESVRELGIQLRLLNQRVGTKLELKEIDFACLDVLSRYGEQSPSALARRMGQHPATVTGILDRLERTNWIERLRDPADRRATVIRVRRDRGHEVLALFAGMNTAIDELCADYDPDQLAVIADFLRRTAEAGASEIDRLAAE